MHVVETEMSDVVVQTKRLSQPLEVEFRNLCFTVTSKTEPDGSFKILNRLNGTCQNGRLQALMGPSGSGKTTLVLNIQNKLLNLLLVGRIGWKYLWRQSRRTNLRQQNTCKLQIVVKNQLLCYATSNFVIQCNGIPFSFRFKSKSYTG